MAPHEGAERSRAESGRVRRVYPTLIRRGVHRGLADAMKPHTVWPLCGLITAGRPADEPEDREEEIGGIEDLVPGIRPGDFFLIVDGDSMVEAGLQPGQYVVIRPEMPGRDGEICAVWVEGSGATLKRVYVEPTGRTIRLVPANPNYTEQTYPADQVHIQGVLVAALAIRKFRS